MKLVLFSMLALLLNTALAGDLVVKVSGSNKLNGGVYIGLCDSEKTLKKSGKVYKGATVKMTKGNAKSYTFKNLPNGDYALKIYLDTNNNNKFDKNALGIPKEPFGLSNNVRPRLGLPAWKALKFTVKDGTTTQQVTLK